MRKSVKVAGLLILLSAGGVYFKPPIKKKNRHTIAGYPRGKPVEIIKYIGFTAGFSKERGCPAWVVYKLDPTKQEGKYKRHGSFMQEKRIINSPVTKNYTRTGYDRGHMAPSKGIWSTWGERAMKETYYMTNICPQRPTLNRRIWKYLEMQLAKDYIEPVYVITGPIYNPIPKHLYKTNIDIPLAFFKIACLNTKQPLCKAWLLSQHTLKGDMKIYQVPIDVIEKHTGLDFMTKLPDNLEDILESIATYELWELEK